jgi:hypothetical protein
VIYYLARPWSDLRSISNSYAARTTVLIPLIGYMILFNTNIIRWLDLVRGLEVSHDPNVIPVRLLFIYFGLCSVAIGVVVYNLACPNEVKEYASAEAYVGDAVHNVPMIVRSGYQRALIDSPYKADLETINGKSYLADEKWRAFLHLYFTYLNRRKPVARVVTACAYALGITLLAIPSGEVFLRIIGIVFGWTSRLI